MVFSIDNLAKPTKEEIAEIMWIIENNPEDLDSRELWVLENFFEGDEDD